MTETIKENKKQYLLNRKGENGHSSSKVLRLIITNVAGKHQDKIRLNGQVNKPIRF